MDISIIVAVAKNNVIGNENKLIWRLSDDLKRFKKLTTGHHILMGRKTFESIGKPLPNRKNLIITRNKDYKVEGGFVFQDIESAIDFAKENGEDELFIIGGGEIYRKLLDRTERIYLTKVHTSPEGDAFFPELESEDWFVFHEEAHLANEKNEHNFVFVDLVRDK